MSYIAEHLKLYMNNRLFHLVIIILNNNLINFLHRTQQFVVPLFFLRKQNPEEHGKLPFFLN